MKLDANAVSAGCIALCIAGLLLLYFFSETTSRTTPLGAKFSSPGASVQFEGAIEKITPKQSGCTISVCGFSGCIGVFAEETTVDCNILHVGQELAIEGRVRQVQAGSKFVQAEKITLG
ncbi:hypothetical protein J4441_05140 [Candidatus Micrarchaeota archaeon]|nr:hypothetical protein [Candidatus Micrarchaeota archaeon]